MPQATHLGAQHQPDQHCQALSLLLLLVAFTLPAGVRPSLLSPVLFAAHRIDWSDDARAIERRLRAFDPFPGASTVLDGEVVKCWRGMVIDAIGAPGDLLYEPVDATANVREDDLVYTAGTIDSRLQSRYPPAVLVGKVSRVDLGDGDLDKRIHVKPAADFLRLDMVQVLTNPNAEDAK